MIQPGSKLAHYEIVSALGKGGMGEVWRARDQKLGREVAIKTLPEEFASDEERLARFEREAKLLASLNHPNIATIHGLEEDNGTRFLVLELVEGDTLADRLKRGAIAVEESLKLALQIAEALEAAHEKGVIHRDLKPANIKVTPDGKVKVLDFGLAKAFVGDGADVNLSHSPTLSMAATQQGVILGTAAYMSPEQARGEATDKRADVWAFGVVLFEMLSGQGTFNGRTVSDVLAGVLRADPDWKSLPLNLHPRIRFLLERCLEKESKDRYGDISDARVDIQKVLSDPDGMFVQPVAEAVQTEPQSKLPWMAGMLLTLIIGGAAVWYLKPADPRPISRFDYELPEGISFTSVLRQVVAISPDGRQFVYGGTGGFYLRAMDGLEAQMIAGIGDANLANPVFSPDGQQIVYRDSPSNSGRLMKVAVTGGAPTVLIEPVGDPFGISWETNGTILYGQLDGIWQVSENGGAPVQLISTEEGEQAYGPQLLPGGEWVLFTLASGTGPGRWDEADIAIESLSSGERRVLRTGGGDARYVPTGHLVYALEDVLFALPFDVDTLELSGGPVSILQGVRRSPGGVTGSAFYSFSDSGTLVYVPGTATGATWLGWVDTNGDIERIDLPAGYYRHPRVSPDGRWLAVELGPDNGQDIYVHESAGNTQPIRLTEGGNNRYPVWSRDGEYVAFQSGNEGDGGIFRRRADGTGPVERLTTPGPDSVHVPEAWSPTEDLLAYSVMSTGSWELWLLNLADGTSERFGDLEASNRFDTVFSPDGEWIAYTQRGTDGVATWVNSLSDPDTRYQIGQAADQGHHPLWTRDGDRLLYFPGAGLPLAVDIQTEPNFGYGQPVPVPGLVLNVAPDTLLNHDAAPDGRFVTVRPEGEDGTSGYSVIVVENWFEELKERVPVP